MSSANGIKTDVDMDAPIKPELALSDDEDTYADDDGELKVPQEQNQSHVWLAKLPKWLWEAWEDIADDQEIEIGKLRIYNKTDQDIRANKVKLLLHDNSRQHSIPKQYNIHVNRQTYNNTVVFSEKDKPGHKAWRPNRVIKPREERKYTPVDPNRVDKTKKKYSSAIPKQVSLAGWVANEVTLSAVENEEFNAFNTARFKEANTSKHHVNFTLGIDRSMDPSSMTANNHFASFTDAASASRPAKKKQTEKAVRVSQEELLDALTNCFKEYKFWSLRALRQRLNQPEAYIKTVVEQIATLMRSGPNNANYVLKPEYERMLHMDLSNVKEEAAAEMSGADSDADDDDADDFEDVKMED